MAIDTSMVFHLSGLIQDGIGATCRFPLRGRLRREDGTPEAFEGEVEFICLQTGILARVHLSLREPEICSRCLKPLEETLKINFEEEFRSAVDLRSGLPIDGEIDPDSFVIDSQHMLDLTEAVRQYRETCSEMAPLCQPDCLGLCPRCGADLNQGPCVCDNQDSDSRWAELSALRNAIVEGKE